MDDQHTLAVPLDWKRYVTDEQYDEEMHRRFLEGSRDIGRRLAERVNERITQIIKGKP